MLATNFLSREGNLYLKRRDLIGNGRIGILLIFIVLFAVHGAYDDSVSLQFNVCSRVCNIHLVTRHLFFVPSSQIKSKFDSSQDIYLTLNAAKKSRRALMLNCKSGWYGNLGNNIITLCAMYSKAFDLDAELDFTGCTHDILKLPEQVHSNVSTVLEITPESAFWMAMTENNNMDKESLIKTFTPKNQVILPLNARNLYQERVLPVIKRSSSSEVKCECTALSQNFSTPVKNLKNYMVIHLRGGDAFGNRNIAPPWTYIPPPLSYFVDVIESNPNRPVIVVTTCDERMVLLELLLEKFSQIHVQCSSLHEDIDLVLAAETLILSSGTFAWSLGMISKSLKVLYCFNGMFQVAPCHLPGVEAYEYFAENYISDWTASEEQIKLIKEHPRSNLRIKYYSRLPLQRHHRVTPANAYST